MGVVGVAVPILVIGPLAQVIFALKLNWLPVGGSDQGWRSRVLPVLVLKRFQLLLNRQGFPRGLVCDSSCSGGSRNAQTLVCRYSRPLPEAF